MTLCSLDYMAQSLVNELWLYLLLILATCSLVTIVVDVFVDLQALSFITLMLLVMLFCSTICTGIGQYSQRTTYSILPHFATSYQSIHGGYPPANTSQYAPPPQPSYPPANPPSQYVSPSAPYYPPANVPSHMLPGAPVQPPANAPSYTSAEPPSYESAVTSQYKSSSGDPPDESKTGIIP